MLNNDDKKHFKLYGEFTYNILRILTLLTLTNYCSLSDGPTDGPHGGAPTNSAANGLFGITIALIITRLFWK